MYEIVHRRSSSEFSVFPCLWICLLNIIHSLFLHLSFSLTHSIFRRHLYVDYLLCNFFLFSTEFPCEFQEEFSSLIIIDAERTRILETYYRNIDYDVLKKKFPGLSSFFANNFLIKLKLYFPLTLIVTTHFCTTVKYVSYLSLSTIFLFVFILSRLLWFNKSKHISSICSIICFCYLWKEKHCCCLYLVKDFYFSVKDQSERSNKKNSPTEIKNKKAMKR